VFADSKVIGRDYYTRLEYHALGLGGYQITNRAFRSSTKDTLGSEVTLSSVAAWAELEPEAVISGIERPLFAYFKMPFANNIDPTSPLGVSVYARAVDMIEQADKQWSDFLWEFESGKRALYADSNAFGRDTDGKPMLPNKRLYRTLESAANIGANGDLFQEWTPTLREVNILNGLDAILKRIEFTCGLAQGTISDPNTVALTATEIKMSKQRTYATIVDTQKALEDALEGLLYAMDVWATLGNLAPRGEYSTSYWWDDSIVADYDTAFAQDMQVLDRVMSRVEFRMRNYGEDEATAKKMIAMMDAERQPVDFFPMSEDA
jgi:A118 family predicted phage portal protein